jgi:hypothetical protein
VAAEGTYGSADPVAESEPERLVRNYAELLQELRVAQAGTQILFAFLLAVAFTVPFQESDDFTHGVFAVTLVLCALATALLIAPAAMHRTLFRQGRKADLVRISSPLALAGLYVLMLACAGVLVLALDVALNRIAAIVVSAIVLAVFVALWVVLPFALHRRP